MGERLGLADVEALFDNAPSDRERFGHADQRAGMTGGQLAIRDQALHLGGSFVSRIILATWLRLLPTTFAISSWLRLNSSASAW